MIGDNLHTDIEFGKAAGIDTALVLTGITTLHEETDIKNIHSLRPTYIFQDISFLREHDEDKA